MECCALHARQRQCTVLKDRDGGGVVRVACVPMSMHRVKKIGISRWRRRGTIFVDPRKHVHINEQPLDEYKRNP